MTTSRRLDVPWAVSVSGSTRIRYATSRDGTKIAWTERGEGRRSFSSSVAVTLATNSSWDDGRARVQRTRDLLRPPWISESQSGTLNTAVDLYADDLEAVANAAGLDEIIITAAAGRAVRKPFNLPRGHRRVTRMFLESRSFPVGNGPNRPDVASLLALLDVDFELSGESPSKSAIGWNQAHPSWNRYRTAYDACDQSDRCQDILLTTRSHSISQQHTRSLAPYALRSRLQLCRHPHWQ